MIDLSKLKALAEAATAGPWSSENNELFWHEDGYTKHLMETYDGSDLCNDAEHPANLRFIAAANPAAVLALIAENEALRSALADCTTSLHGEMLQKFHGQPPGDMHPVTRREYDLDMAEVAEYHSLLGKGEQP